MKDMSWLMAGLVARLKLLSLSTKSGPTPANKRAEAIVDRRRKNWAHMEALPQVTYQPLPDKMHAKRYFAMGLHYVR